jgi:hypothetical protein
MTAQNKLPEAALEFFRKKGRKGGRQRAANLTPAQRSEQARNAVQARWTKQAAKASKKRGIK